MRSFSESAGLHFFETMKIVVDCNIVLPVSCVLMNSLGGKMAE